MSEAHIHVPLLFIILINMMNKALSITLNKKEKIFKKHLFLLQWQVLETLKLPIITKTLYKVM